MTKHDHALEGAAGLTVHDGAAAHADASSARAEHAHGDGGGHHDGELPHALPIPLLMGVFGALLVLTFATVAVTYVDLGATLNFTIAMVIATVKALLVMGVFMHLLWDGRFNVFVFLSSVLFVVLFITLSLQDKAEYQSSVEAYRAAQAAAKKP